MTKNLVMFECSFQMNRTEISEYLKSIYNVETLSVHTEVVDGERFKISIPPEVGTKTHTNPHKKIAYVTMKDTEFTYPSTDLFEEILQTERPVKEAANLLEEGYVKEAEETPRLKSWKIAVFARRGE